MASSSSYDRNLAKAVRANPCLWDRNDNNYGRRVFRRTACERISNQLHGTTKSANFVRKRWQRLRSRYVKYLRSATFKFQKVFDELTFLDDHLQQKKEKPTASDPEDDFNLSKFDEEINATLHAASLLVADCSLEFDGAPRRKSRYSFLL